MLLDLDDGPRELRLGTLPLRVGPLRVRHLVELRRHLAARGRDPLDRLLRRLHRFEDRHQEVLLRRAYEDLVRAGEVGWDEVNDYLSTVEGMAHALSLCAAEVESDVARDEIEQRLNEMLATDYFEFVDHAMAAMRLSLGNLDGRAKYVPNWEESLGPIS